jgi:hypothetical protein
MYKCEICGKRRGFGMDHSKCSKILQERHKGAERPVRTVQEGTIRMYCALYARR